MDGTLAAIFLIASMTDMALTDCPTGCLAPDQAVSMLSFQVAKVQSQDKIIGDEILIGYDFGTTYGPFQPTIAASVSDQGDTWLGAGVKWTTQGIIDNPFYVESSLLPGIYAKGDGPDLGGTLHFRASLGAGYAFENGATMTVLYDHRSNADTQIFNPGLETIAVKFAFPF